MSMTLGFSLVQECAACEQFHDEKVPDGSMPRLLTPAGIDRVDAELCLRMGICAACNRTLLEADDLEAVRQGLRKLGFEMAPPPVKRCPPASVAVPIDWL